MTRLLPRLLFAAVLMVFVFVGPARGVTAAPTGVTALALDGRVDVAWQSVGGASEYQVFRGTSVTTINQLVSPPGHSAASFSDTGRTNGQAYFYAVRAVSGGEASAASRAAGATPLARSCSSGNPVRLENCFPGTAAFKTDPGSMATNAGIEGFAVEASVDTGESVDLKVNTGNAVPYRIEIYRTGWYGGQQGRLISTVPGLSGVSQPACVRASDGTGLRSCTNWSATATISTTAAWTSGVYVLKLVREDNGKANQILLTVRDDDDGAKILYSLPDATYQAYNNYGGRSVYAFNSSGDDTVAGTTQAVKVSWDRPFQQVASRQRDFYTFTDLSAVSWLERQGYSLSYSSSFDLHQGVTNLNAREVILLGAHHEYWSAEMRTRLKGARDAGVNVLSLGANGIYWKTRHESSDRTMVVYKTTATGVPDPSGINTGTWRDPAGADDPENGILGGMYVGDNDSVSFGLRVSQAEGQQPFWRYTAASSLGAGQSLTIGTAIVGWEWDARVANGREPSGVQTLSTTPVNGDILQDAGRVLAPGNAMVNATLYEAGSGAKVFSSGTNYWSRGLAVNARGQGNVRAEIQQATANMLSDMGVRPTTPDGVTLDPSGPPTAESLSPASGATGVAAGTNVRASFDRAMDPATITNSTFTLRRTSGGPNVAATVSYDAGVQEAVLNPGADLDPGTQYTATLTTGVQDGGGTPLAAPVSWSFTTDQPGAPVVSSRVPAQGATGVTPDADVTATFDVAMNAATITGSSFTLEGPGGAGVAATVSYDAGTRTARLNPTAALVQGASYTARLSTGIESTAGVGLAAAVSWSFTVRAPFTVTERAPAPLSTGVAVTTVVSATFSRAANPATVNGSTVTLEGPGGAAVAAAVSYDGATLRAVLAPSTALAPLTTYTARIGTGVQAPDGQALDQPVSWTFSTAASAPPPPSVTARQPAAGANGASRTGDVLATFDQALDPTTVTAATFTLTPQGGSVVGAAVSYDDATRTARLDPAATLTAGTTYTARLTTGVRSATGVALPADVTWTFITAGCPCQLFSPTLTPAVTNAATRDGRPGPGPWSYELGLKVEVTAPVQLKAVRFYKAPLETGTHVARVWSASGTPIAQVTFVGESGSGWQEQALSTPVDLVPGSVYVVSVGFNTYFSITQFGLQNQVVSGPLRSVAVATNGVYGASAGVFPTSSYRSSNYMVDAVVE